MPKGSPELTNKRKDEVMDACEKLYQIKGFHDIAIRDISEETSMLRPSVYNYYETKGEIFLALLIREYQKWTEDVRKFTDAHDVMLPDDLAQALAGTLSPCVIMLKISAMNLCEI